METPEDLDCEPEDGEPYHDHDLDWPWTLYFNGEPVPRWANCWNYFRLAEKSRDMFEVYPWFADHSDFVRLCQKMDQAHQVLSEDPVLFRILTLTMLVLMLGNEARLREPPPAAGGEEVFDPGEPVFESMRDGIAAMHMLTIRDGFSIWSVGYPEDRERLAAVIERSRLPPPPPPPEGYAPPPHILERNRLAEEILHALRRALLDIIRAGGQPKHIRRFIHELPTRVWRNGNSHPPG